MSDSKYLAKEKIELFELIDPRERGFPPMKIIWAISRFPALGLL